MDKHRDGSCNNGRNKWSKGGCRGVGGRGGGNPDSSVSSGVQLMGNKWVCFYKHKNCGWNMIHTYGFHFAWVQNKSYFTLPATHKFRVNTVTVYEPSQKGEPATDASTAGSSLTGYIVQTGALAGIFTSSKDITKAQCSGQ